MNQQNKSDALEILIILAMFLLILVIYVPVAIWEEETYYEKESRYRMQNLNERRSNIKKYKKIIIKIACWGSDLPWLRILNGNVGFWRP